MVNVLSIHLSQQHHRSGPGTQWCSAHKRVLDVLCSPVQNVFVYSPSVLYGIHDIYSSRDNYHMYNYEIIITCIIMR